MDRWLSMAFAILFAELQSPKVSAKVVPALAKLYVLVQSLATSDATLAGEITRRGGYVR